MRRRGWAARRWLAVVIVALVALAATGCGGGHETTIPSPAATASRTGPLLVYTKQVRETEAGGRAWPTVAVVTYDIGAKRKVASFEIGGVGEYLTQVAVAGNKIIANLEQRVVMYDIDGSSPRVLREAASGGHIIGIGASPDGTKLALTEARTGFQGADLAAGTYVVVLDLASGEDLLTVPQSAPGFAGFTGQAATITWRDDGSGFVVQGYTYSDYGGGTATVMLDGSVRTRDLPGYVLVAPSGRRVSYGAYALSCGISGLQSEIVLYDLTAQTEVASVGDESLLFMPREWSPDGTELLYSTYSQRPSSDCPGVFESDPASERLHVLLIDGSPPEPVSDVQALYRRWLGDRYFEFRCLGEVRRDMWCLDEQGVNQPVDIYVGDSLVDSGLYARVIGFIDR